MNINVTVTHTASPELLAAILALGGKPTPVKLNGHSSNGKAKSNEAPAETEAVEVTIEQIRAAVQTKSQAGKREAIKTLLNEFGAAKVTSLEKQQYPEFLEKVNAL